MSDECINSFDCANGDHSDACPVHPWYTPESVEQLLLRHCKCHLTYESEFIAKHLNLAFKKGIQFGSAKREVERSTLIDALKTCWQEYWWMDEEHRGVTIQAFCEMRGITAAQFEAWGIDK